MSLTCSCDIDYEDGWWYWVPEDYTTLNTSRRKRCCSCHELVEMGSTCAKFVRQRGPRTDIEENIHGDEVPLAPYYMCEECSDLFFSLSELGFCLNIGGNQNMHTLVAEYADQYGANQAGA